MRVIWALWVLYMFVIMIISGVVPALLVWATLRYAWILIGLTLPLSLGVYYFTLFVFTVYPSKLVRRRINIKKTREPKEEYFKKLSGNPCAMIYMFSQCIGVSMAGFLYPLICPFTTYMYKFMGARIGKGTSVYGKIIDPMQTTIGSNTKIGYEAVISGHVDNGEEWVTGPVRIGNNCLVGGLSIIGPGVTIEDDCVIAAGSMILSNKRISKGTKFIPGKV
jgi:acetyltransferase-like isoleucine patch superfamily enzyme